MIDIKLVREAPEKVRKNLEKRKNPEKLKLLDKLVKVDSDWRKKLQTVEKKKQERNTLTKEIESLKREKQDFSKKITEAQKTSSEIKSLEKEVSELNNHTTELLFKIPNLLHESVPFGESDEANKRVKKWGEIKKPSFELIHHGKLAADLNQADFERAVKISGTGFFALKNQLVLLDLALQKFALDQLIKKGFHPIQPPFLMSQEPYKGVTDLDFFKEQLYKTEENQFLIATSEHPIAAMHMGEILKKEELPIKYAGISPCFRKEVGKHGIDERGFFRVHQFNKIEQFIFCTEDQSWDLFEELAKNTEELLEALKIPYERTNVCTGDIGDIATKKYDINGYSPREKKYIELMSCSHCSDYQARNLKIRYREGEEKKFVHTLNNTAVATTRLLRVLIEQYQTDKKTIKIPTKLQPYMNGLKEITQD